MNFSELKRIKCFWTNLRIRLFKTIIITFSISHYLGMPKNPVRIENEIKRNQSTEETL